MNCIYIVTNPRHIACTGFGLIRVIHSGATFTADSSDHDPSTYWVAPARNFTTSARLHLQHHLFQKTIEYLSEPHVQSAVAEAKELRVADLGCGNGVWLSDLDSTLSENGVSAQLDGYDVNTVNFPAPVFLPEKVTLKKLDTLARPLPEELIGAYDIIHARVLGKIRASSVVPPLLSTALAWLC